MIDNLKRHLTLNSRIWTALLGLVAVSIPATIKINGFFILLSILVWLIAALIGKYRFKFPMAPQHYLLILVFLLHVIGLTYTENLKYGLSYIERIYTLAAFPLLIGSLEFSDKQHTRKVVLLAFAFSTLFTAALYLFFSGDGIDNILSTTRTYRGLHLLFSIAVLLYYAFLSPDFSSWGNEKVALCLMIPINAFLLIQSGSKTAIFLLPVVVVIFLFFYPRKKSQLIISTMIVALGCLATYYVIQQNEFVSSRIEKLATEGTDYIRLRNWKTNWTAIQENLFFGVGTGDSVDELQRRRETSWQEYIEEYNSHNQYLEITLRLGISGLAVFVLFLTLHFIHSLRSLDFVYLILILIFSISCLTESLLVRQKGIVFLAFFSPFLFGTSVPKKKIH